MSTARHARSAAQRRTKSLVLTKGGYPMDGENLHRRRLAAELAVAVSQFVQATLPDDTDERGYVFHSFGGPFDEDCYTVWELGAAWGAQRPGGLGVTYREWEARRAPEEREPSEFRFMPDEDIRRVVLECEDIPPSRLLRLIMAYLRSMADYGWRGAQLNLGRTPFVPDPVFEPQVEALIGCGYLKRSGAMVEWTDQIAEAMTTEGLWNEARIPFGVS
jgi:hypothetical protein